MGGKRPDQYQIDPAEAGATDYKNLPQTGRGNSNLDDTVTGDQQRLAESQEKAQGQPFLPDIPAPSVHTRRGKEREDTDADPDSPAV